MKRVAFIIIMLVGCLIFPNIAKAQKVKDAFVLVDVSGSMKYTQINSEAKQIISSLLRGNFSLSNFSGWSRVTTKGLDGDCPLLSGNSTSLISAGGKVCVLPFGNMDRVKDYKFVDLSNFESSFNSSFPTVFNDSWTYITLAKAYAVNVASTNDILGMVYMIIFSDGAEESMDGRVGYSDEFRSIVDYFGTHNDSFCQKKGILRKLYNGKQFDIEIWTMGPIPPPVSNCIKCGQNPCICKEPEKIAIIDPTGGKSPKDLIKVDVKENISLKWKNANGKTTINVQKKDGDSFANIPVNEKDNHYTINKKGNLATLTFYKDGEYKVIVANSNSRDVRYFIAETPILPIVMPIIIIAVLVVCGIYLWSQVFNKPKPPFDNNYGGENYHVENNNDWN